MWRVAVLRATEPEETLALDGVVLPVVVEVHLHVRGADVHLEGEDERESTVKEEYSGEKELNIGEVGGGGECSTLSQPSLWMQW